MKTILIALAVAIAGILLFATTRPDTFRVERTITIQAPPEKIIPFLEDFHQWPAWSPYEKLDPAMKRTLSGAERGKGAVYQWDGNRKAGSGRMEVLDVVPSSKVSIQLEFTQPLESKNLAEFDLMNKGGATSVTWSMSGPQPYVTKVVTIFVSMDKLVGGDFETGLVNLKAAAEK
ncbi:SRPBCC family protein [Paludibaculum fermentans]|uniref:SRPBCC family protein n=1 Tax=Paludibaculum fermentans TaxID=1473598 RepID=A0A7S7SLW8_PALFE|nr:SRPBCC family protein [Paludibaculum fermentans]QOY88480.1 SRPBCC family protein [Paludibaculum fermentans]